MKIILCHKFPHRLFWLCHRLMLKTDSVTCTITGIYRKGLKLSQKQNLSQTHVSNNYKDIQITFTEAVLVPLVTPTLNKDTRTTVTEAALLPLLSRWLWTFYSFRSNRLEEFSKINLLLLLLLLLFIYLFIIITISFIHKKN